jgi:NAD(P)-dependent dehydrogenase (short-subunit alcohol dehydrogenase family)
MSNGVAGKCVVITGGNAGIGKETAVGLARDGARVVITSRDAARGAAAVTEIRERSGNNAVDVMALDLASLASVHAFANELLAREDRLDVLIDNAGLILRRRTETENGFETTFGVNHLGHFVLTGLLLDRLRASAPSRVVVVSSDAHKSARHGLDFDDLQSERRYRAVDAYGKSKLANIYFARELARRLDGSGVTANSLHPGFVASRFARDGDLGWIAHIGMPLVRPFALSSAAGARTSIHLASSPDVEGLTGHYFYKCAPLSRSKVAQDDEAARRLWAVSEELVGSARRSYLALEIPATGITPANSANGRPLPSGRGGPSSPLMLVCELMPHSVYQTQRSYSCCAKRRLTCL